MIRAGHFYHRTIILTLAERFLVLGCVTLSNSDSICCICLCFSFSLFGVCLMAFHQAQYILNEFSTPSIRSNHNSVLSRDNGPVNNITPNGVKYVQSFSETLNCLTNIN